MQKKSLDVKWPVPKEGRFGLELTGGKGKGTSTDAFKNYWKPFFQGFVVHADKLKHTAWALFLRENFGAIYICRIWKVVLSLDCTELSDFLFLWAICKKFPFSGTKFLKGEHWRFLFQRILCRIENPFLCRVVQNQCICTFINIRLETCLGGLGLDSSVMFFFFYDFL